VKRLAEALDAKFRIPGTRFRFGWDSLLGLIPGADLATALPALYILFEARRLKMPKSILSRMVGNILLDTAVGLVPLVGDLFDFVFKANVRNARLFEKGLKKLRDDEVIDV
jgi:hypothetical protein